MLLSLAFDAGGRKLYQYSGWRFVDTTPPAIKQTKDVHKIIIFSKNNGDFIISEYYCF